LAVDEGHRDDYLRQLREIRQGKKAELDKVKDTLSRLKLEDDAQVLLTAEQNTVLQDAGVIDVVAVANLQEERDKLNAEIDAIQALSAAVRTLT